MTANEIVLRFIDVFDELSIPYMLAGSYSSNLYGRPRSTKDADFVVQLSGDPIAAIAQKLGGDFLVDPQMSFETVTATMRYVVTHQATPFKVETFLLSDDPHDRARFERRVSVDFEGRKVWMPTSEDVVITKLRWSRQGKRHKDMEDVRNVLLVSGAMLDLTYVRQWCDQHQTRELFEKLLAEANSK